MYRHFRSVFVMAMIASAWVSLVSCNTSSKKYTQPECRLTTPWTEKVDYSDPWPEYPRPQLTRKSWMNLNGTWEYAITDTASSQPGNFGGLILVPYPVESCLSGVGRAVGPGEKIWYRREFTLKRSWDNKRILLHFEGSDWRTTVWVNGEQVGRHEGGYDNFTFDITTALRKKGRQEVVVSVWDPTDSGVQPRGKQVSRPGGIFYTACSGIWQTVWLEPVGIAYFSGFKMFPELDSAELTIQPGVEYSQSGDRVEFEMIMPGGGVSTKSVPAGLDAVVPIPDLLPWSPDSPYLYDITARLIRDGAVLDEVATYAAIRKVSLGKDARGHTRILLNNEFVFQNGLLDQGFWPDGIYTPPTEKAMLFDLESVMKMGFNMLRKHVKVEPRRYYYHCDRLGMLVWQDMPSTFFADGMVDSTGDVPEEIAWMFEYELRRLIDSRFNHPSIIMWVLFNEGWGQHRTADLVARVRVQDPTRLINNASGWTDMGVGDVLDVHHYPEPAMPSPDTGRAIVLGEFGGLGYPVEGHSWVKESWGYKAMTSQRELFDQYAEFVRQVRLFDLEGGLSASVYTQLTDVESETNGLITYDRMVFKMSTDSLFTVNRGR